MESNQGTTEGSTTGGPTGTTDTPGPWVAQFSEDLKSNPAWTGMRTINDLGKSFLTMKERAAEADGLKEKLNGAIVKPGENATTEEMEAFYRSLGRPDKPTEYQFGDTQLPENLSSLRDYDDAFKTMFHQVGLNAAQANALHKGIIDMVLDQNNRNSELSGQHQQRAIDALKNEWKDAYGANIELAVRGMRKAGELAGVSDELTKFMNDSRLGDHPLLIKVFHAIGKAISEDTALGTGGLFNKEKDVPRGPDGRPMLRFPSMEK